MSAKIFKLNIWNYGKEISLTSIVEYLIVEKFISVPPASGFCRNSSFKCCLKAWDVMIFSELLDNVVSNVFLEEDSSHRVLLKMYA